MDFAVVLLLALLLLVVFLIWCTDPFDETKQKTEQYQDSGRFEAAGLVAQKHWTALRQRPTSHTCDGASQLPRPNAAQRGTAAHGARDRVPRPTPALSISPLPPAVHNAAPHIYFEPGPDVPDKEACGKNTNFSSRSGEDHLCQSTGARGAAFNESLKVIPPVSLLKPSITSPVVTVTPLLLEADPMSNVLTQPVAGLRRSKPLVSFEHAAPWLRARTRSNSLELDTHVEKEAVPIRPSAKADASTNPSRAEAHRSTSHMQILNLKDIDLQDIIGGGAFGQVWRGSWNGTPVAVKTIPMLSRLQPQSELCGQVSGEAALGHGHDSALLEAFEDEVHIFAGLRHPNICLFIGACLSPPTRAIITELVPRGSLWEALRTPGLFEISHGSSYFWPWWILRRVIDGTCRGLVYLHSHSTPIIHRDLKSANVLLDESFNPKICDFGLARLKDLNNVMTANVGTAQVSACILCQCCYPEYALFSEFYQWMSPEVITGSSYSEKADIYSLAIVAWEIITGKCPFDGMSQLEVLDAPHICECLVHFEGAY